MERQRTEVLQEVELVRSEICGYKLKNDCILSFADPTLLNDPRVLNNLLALEDRYLPSPNYFQFQSEVQVWMRETVARWMLEVCEEQKCEDDVFPVAMNYLDRFLSATNIRKTQLQLLGASCMYVASKLKETLPLQGNKIVIYTDNSISLDELLKWELLLIQKLKWDLSAITPNDFLLQFLVHLPATPNEQRMLRRHAQIFISLCYAAEFSFSVYSPSMVAAAALCTAATGIFGRQWCVANNLAKLFHNIAALDVDILQSVQERIEKLVTVNLPQVFSVHSNDTQWVPSTPESAKYHPGAPTTPTDVRDIDVS